MTGRLLAVLSLSALAAAAFASPSVLIVQTFAPKKGDVDPNFPVYNYIAKEMDDEGRCLPIVYGITDPVFRAATEDGRINHYADKPTLKQALEAAQSLHAEYVLVYGAVHEGKLLKERARLYKNGRVVWKDEQDMAVSLQDAVNPENTGRSLARTMVLRMGSQPFKGLPTKIKADTPDLSPGQIPVVHDTQLPVVADDDEKLKKDASALVAAGKKSNALTMLRDAVDARPFDVDRRLDLIDALMADNPEGAAEEARRAAGLMPEKSELRAMAARAWMQAGKPDEAQKDLNEAVARDPGGSGTRLMLGELSVTQLQPEKAIDHLDQAVKQNDTGYARFLRAVCRAMLGGVDGMKSDLQAADKLEPQRSSSEDKRRYTLAADVADRLAAKDAAEIRNLNQRIVVKPKDKDLRDEIDQTLRLLDSRTALLGLLKPPPEAKAQHEQRLLVHRLLSQCLHDLQVYSASGDEDSLGDTRINLSEALKQLAALRASK